MHYIWKNFHIPAPSGVPEDFLPMSVTDRSISLAWGPPHACQQNGNITGYTIYLSENYQPCYLNGLSKRNHVVNVSDREVTVESLNADTTYTLSVAARNRVGIGPCSLPLNITTMKSGILCVCVCICKCSVCMYVYLCMCAHLCKVKKIKF